MSRNHIMEPLPEHYSLSQASREFGETNPDRALLENLRTEVGWNPDAASVMKSLYSASRILGDIELYDNDPTQETSRVLDPSRSYAYPEKYKDLEGEEGSLTAGSHSEIERSLNVNIDRLFAVADTMSNYFESIGEPLKHPGDAALFTMLGVASHESGHALLSGVSRLEREVPGMDVDYSKLLATRTYLGANPELGFTGNWETDVRIHEERFAEGYSQMVMRKVLKTLEYDGEQSETIMSFMDAGFTWKETQEGEHQLDHLEKVNAGTAINEVMQGLLDQDKLVKTNQHYIGDLGYSAPLTRDEMIAQLRGLHRLLTDRKADQANPADLEWEAQVKSGQSPETKAVIEGLRAKRAAELQMQKEVAKQQTKRIRRRRILGAFSLRKAS